ncbi:hypothetical protein NA57DRAFT_73654 [Rhizodiscina lignyota]|uniref:BTB domain-containing protein n=1 Tax=Rhizodiscina lignyota TaxID=1504668 RepID=A0A9P4MC97_9PEZI|nr:hypothetical protein NA57DRAFT_73654 [Rhizodiscina lignyota]
MAHSPANSILTDWLEDSDLDYSAHPAHLKVLESRKRKKAITASDMDHSQMSRLLVGKMPPPPKQNGLALYWTQFFCDFTIICSDRTFPEAQLAQIHLRGEDASVVESMVEYMYALELPSKYRLDYMQDYGLDFPGQDAKKMMTEAGLHLAKLYIAADKYVVHGLKDLCAFTLQEAFGCWWRSEPSLPTGSLVDLAEYVYSETVQDSQLRTVIRNEFREFTVSKKTLFKDDKYKARLISNPELLYDVLSAISLNS